MNHPGGQKGGRRSNMFERNFTRSNFRSYAEVIKGKGNCFHNVGSSVRSKAHLKFHSNVEEMSKFAKAYVGVVENLGQSYTM